jgi:Ca2+-binding EF-hand superfamily protein
VKTLSIVSCQLSVVLFVGLLGPTSTATCADPKATVDSQEFVFLGEARPVLVRVHARVDGNPLHEAADVFFTYLFNYLDVDGDGALSLVEVERVPSLDQIFSGGLGGRLGFGGGGGRRKGGGDVEGPKMEDLDANKDGEVTRDELADYYRKKGFIPYQFQLSPPAASFNITTLLGGSRPEPSVDAVRKAIFALLNTNHDGKLTKDELAAAPKVLLRLDEDDDEIISAKELVPDAPSANPLAGYASMMAGPSKKDAAANNSLLIPAPTTQAETDQLVLRLLERYGPKSAKPLEKKLSRKDIGLDEAAFKQLDTDSDGKLDGKELAAGFVKRDPDLELVLRLGKKAAAETTIEVLSEKGRPAPLAEQFAIKDGSLLLDLRLTLLELRVDDVDSTVQLASIARQAVLAQFKQADTDNQGYLDETKAKANRLFGPAFKAMDRDHDGKVTEKEVNAYLDEYAKIQVLARAACVTLALTDVSRGLFDLLDTDRDGRLSVREMRHAPKLLDKFDRIKKGFLTEDDIPRSYRVTARQGPAGAGALGQEAMLFALYLGNNAQAPTERAGPGPAWFRKMDRNGDRDVSRKEFLGSDEQFRKIDADGDGLISLEEALRFDASLRKGK